MRLSQCGVTKGVLSGSVQKSDSWQWRGVTLGNVNRFLIFGRLNISVKITEKWFSAVNLTDTQTLWYSVQKSHHFSSQFSRLRIKSVIVQKARQRAYVFLGLWRFLFYTQNFKVPLAAKKIMRGEIDRFKYLVRICLRTTIEHAFCKSENGLVDKRFCCSSKWRRSRPESFEARD
jgi:hypothetical protein